MLWPNVRFFRRAINDITFYNFDFWLYAAVVVKLPLALVVINS